MSLRRDAHEGTCKRTGVVYHRNDAVESKMPHEMLHFTRIETAAGGRESRRCKTAVPGYVRAMSALCSRYSCACSFGSAL